MIGPIIALLMFVTTVCAKEWNPNSMPNPRANNGYKACKMRSLSSVCDPDAVLTEPERYRLNTDLLQLAHRTAHSSGNYCQMKGIEAILVIVESGSQQLANSLNKLWNIDGQCKKAVIFLLSARDHRFYYSGEENTGLTSADFDKIVSSQQQLLSEGKFMGATSNILKEIAKSQAGNGGDSGVPDAGIPYDNGCTVKTTSLVLASIPFVLRFL